MNAIADSVPLTLACHPETPSQAIQGIHAVVGTARGDNPTLMWPSSGAATSSGELVKGK